MALGIWKPWIKQARDQRLNQASVPIKEDEEQWEKGLDSLQSSDSIVKFELLYRV